MKRIISFVLCLSMLISMLPVSAFAAEPEETVISETTAATEATQEPETTAPAEEPTEEPTEESAEEPTEEPTEESTEAPAEEPAEEPTVETEPEETEPEVETGVITTLSGSIDTDDDEDPFASYVDFVFNGTDASPLGTAAGDKLSGDVKLAYGALVPVMREIAAGERDSAVVAIGHDLGKVSVNGVVSTYTPDVEVAFTGTTFGYDELAQLMDALLLDLPYELYWMDKVSGYSVVPLVTSSGKMFLTFSFYVSADYSATGAESTYDLDTTATGAATAAAANAQAIVAEFAGASDYDMLTAYKDRICELASYNHSAADDDTTPYGDPWQMIHVFDEDDSTQVVCEGYAKAFQYLCEQSVFGGSVASYLVTGDMTSNGETGRHMWNVVAIEDSSYLVDVTNCDNGYALFLAGTEAGSDGSYTIAGANFVYDEDTLNTWGSILSLSSDYYDPDAQESEETVPGETVPEEEVAMTGRELQELVADLTGQYTLTGNVVISEDLVLTSSAYLTLDQNVTITVTNGATVELQCILNGYTGSGVTVEEGSKVIVARSLGIGTGAALTVAEGAELTIDGSVAMAYGASAVIDGTLTNSNWLNVGMGNLTVNGSYVHNSSMCVMLDVNGTVTGIDGSLIDLEATLYGLDGLEDALNADHAGYASYTVKLSSPFTQTGPSTEAMVLERDITIPEGVTLQLNAYTGQTDTLNITGNVVVDGSLCIMSAGVLNVTGTVTVNGSLANFGAIYNEGTILLSGEFQNDGSFTGNEPVELTPLDRFLMAIEAAAEGGDVTIWDSVTLEEDLTVSIPGTLSFADYARLEVPAGITLTLNCSTAFNGAHLQVSGKLINNGNLSFSDANSEGSFTVDGYFDNYGTCWISDGSEMNINYNSGQMPGTVVSYGPIHVGFGRGGTLSINGGELTTYAYLNNQDTININDEGWLCIQGVHTFNDGTQTNGYLQAGGTINIYGYLDIYGGMTLGNEEGDSAAMEIMEGGELCVDEKAMWCDILATGTLVNNGTLINNSIIHLYGTFENNGTVEGNAPADSETAARQQFLAVLAQGGDVTLTESVTLIDEIEIIADSLTITNGAVLTLDGNTDLNDTDLYVDGEGSALVINGPFYADLGSDSYFTNGAELIVNGTVTEWRGNLVIGGEDNTAAVTVNGTMNKSYNRSWYIYPDSSLYVAEGATLILDTNGEVNGSLNLWSNAEIYGEAIIRGGLWIGETENGWNGRMYFGETASLTMDGGNLDVASGSELVLNGTMTTTENGGCFYNGGETWLTGSAEVDDLYNEGTIHGIGLRVYNQFSNHGQFNVNGSVEIAFDEYAYNSGNIDIRADGNLTGSLNLLASMENYGSINVYEGASLTVHEGRTLINTGDSGWQEDDEIARGHLFVRGAVYVNGTLENSGYISVGDYAEGADPYSSSEVIQIGTTGTLINREDGAFDIRPTGTLNIRGAAENYGVGNGIQNEGLIWLDGSLDNYGVFGNHHHLQINFFGSEDDILGRLTVHEGTGLENRGYISLMNGGGLTVDGELVNLWSSDDSHGSMDLNGSVQISGHVQVSSDLYLPGKWEDDSFGVQSCSITVNEGGTLNVDGTLCIYENASVTNNGEITYGRNYAVDGGTFEGNEPVSLGFETLMAKFDYAIENGEDVHFNGTVIIPEGEHTFPALAEERWLHLADGAKLIVSSGANLIVNCPVSFADAELIVEEGGIMTTFGPMNFNACDGDYDRASSATIDGELVNNGSLWLAGTSEMTVGGYLRSSDSMHIGFDGGAALNINGTMDNFGYLNVVPGGGALNVGEGAVLNIDIYEDENGEITNVGFLQAGGSVTADGTVNLYGFCELGHTEDADPAVFLIGENGLLNIEAKYRDPRAYIGIRLGGSLQVQGTLAQVNNSFIDLSGGEFEITGTYDESAGYGFINSYLSGVGGYSVLPALPADRVTLFAVVGSMDEINRMLSEFQSGGYSNATIRIENDFTLYEDLELPAGVALLVTGESSEEDPITFEIAEGIALTTRANVQMAEHTEIINNGFWTIEGDMAAFSNYRVENNGSITVAPGGTMTLNAPVNYQGEGCLYASFVSTEEYGRISGIDLSGAILVKDGAATEQELREALSFAEENGYGQLEITVEGDITLAEDLVIPENVSIQCFSVFTVPEGVAVTNNGNFYFTNTLAIDGTWEGRAPFGTGFATLTGAGSYLTQEQLETLLAEAEAAGGEAWLSWNLILEEDLELNHPLIIDYTASLTVPEGVTLTVGEAGELNVYGDLAVTGGGKILNNGLVYCEINGSATFADGGYEAGTGSFRQGYSWGMLGSVTGVGPEQLTLAMTNCTMEEAIRETLACAEENLYGGSYILITWNVTLTEDLVIPENAQLVIGESGSLTVPEGITVTNNGSVEVYGCLGLNGTWEGNAWTGDGEIVGISQTITQEQFLQMMAEAEDHAELNAVLTLTEDLLLDKALVISEFGKLLVPEGITLTNGNVIDVYGTLLVEEGGVIDNGSNAIWTDIGASFLMYGQYIGETEGWNIQNQYDGYDSMANIEGFETSEQVLCAEAAEEQQLRNLIDLVQNEGYCNGGVWISEMSITSDLYIPENVYVEMRSSCTVWVDEGVTVTNDNIFVVGSGSTLVVDGQWAGNDPYVMEGGSVTGGFFYMSQDELQAQLDAQGTVYLKKSVTLDYDMTIQPGQQLILEDFGELIVPEGIRLENYGLIQADYTGRVIVEGTIYNAGTINAHMDGYIDFTGGNYEQEDWAEIKLALYGENGSRSNAAILGVPNHMLSVTVDGNDEELIREALDMGAESVGINLYADLELSRGLYLAENVTLNIETGDENYATLTVPYGTTLTNDGRLRIGHHGALVIEGRLAGALPSLNDDTAAFLYGENADILYSQELLEEDLARAAETGESVALSIPLTLTGDLVIPENTTLVISGGSLTIPAGRTLTANSWVDVVNNGTLICQKGGTVINNCGLAALLGGTIDLAEGAYIHNEGARVHKHYHDWGAENITDSTVQGIPSQYISKYYDGWDEAHLRTALLRAEQLEASELNVTIIGELTLTEDLTIPENVYFRICDGGVLTVPNGITLTNRGRMEIDANGTLLLRSRGVLEGYQPLIVSQDNAQYLNEAAYTEEQFRTDIAEAAETGHELFVSSGITLTADLEIPENVVITFSGAVLEIPTGVTLTNHGRLWTMQGGTIQGTGGVVVNDGLIYNHDWGCLYMDDPANFQPTHRAETYFVHYGDQWGNVSHPTVDGILPEHMTIVVKGCNENNLREVLDYVMGMADSGTPPKRFEINITDGELRLSSDLDIPDYAQLNVGNFGSFSGTLIVPEDVTLNSYGCISVSDGGWLVVEPGGILNNFSGGFDIFWDGHVHIWENAELNGSHPGCFDHGSEYINDNVYDQDYLEEKLAEAAANGGSFTLSTSIRLERDLEIPENVHLLITGRDNFLIIPSGIAVNNHGSIYCHMFGGILSEGGGLNNAGAIRALNWGVVDMSAGGCTKLDEGMVYNHHWAYLEGGSISHPTVLGVSPDCLTFEMEGDNDYILHELIGHIGNMLDNGEEPAGFNGTVTGDMRLTGDIYWPGCGYLRINEGCSLTVAAGTTLYLFGILDIRGQLIVEEGGRVIAYRPIEVTVEDAIVNNSGYPINWYNPDTALEHFEVSVDSDYTHHANISIDVCEPEGANVVDIQYQITEGSAGFLVEGSYSGSDPIIVSRENRVSIYGTASGTVTVQVTPVLGYDENDEPILSELYDSVTVTVPQLSINAMGGAHPMDFIIDSHPGLYEGNTMQFYGMVTDVETQEIVEKEVVYTLSDDSKPYATLEVIDGICHLTAAEELDEAREISISMDLADGSAATTVMAVTLMPKPESVDILRDNVEIVTGETILFDLNREGYNAWLQTAADPACATLTNDNASRYNGGQIVHWASSDEEIATVDTFGNVYFQGGLGEVTISMTTYYDMERTVSVTFDVVKLPQAITFWDDARISLVGGSGEGLFVLDQDTGETVDNSMIRWTLCDRFGEPIESHAYASITADLVLTTKPVADETKVFLMARTISGAELAEPVEVTVLPEISFVQILDVVDDPINGKHLLYDLNMMGETYQLSCSAIPCAEAAASVVWASDNTGVASIDESGLITATGEHGDVNFTMTVTDLAGNEFSASFKMTFGIFTNSFALTAELPDGTVTDEPENLVVYGGESIRFTAENLDYCGAPMEGGVKWDSDNSAASVSDSGLMTTRAVTVPTEVILTLSSEDQFCSRQIPVTLLPETVESDSGAMDALVIRTGFVFVSGTTHTIAAEGSGQLYAVDARTGEILEDVVWTSSNEDIACVFADGRVQAYDIQSTCTITALDTYGRESSFTLKVGKLSEAVEITSGSFEVASGGSLPLAGTVTYSDGSTDENVIWSMTDAYGESVRSSIAALSDEGVLTAAEGLTRAVTVTVRATPADGNPLAEDAVAVTIRPAATGVEIFADLDSDYATDITNTGKLWDLAKGETIKLTAMVYPYYGENAPLNAGNAMRAVTWSSSDPAVAEAAADGTVTCLKSGTVTITATASSGAAASFQLVITKLMDTLELPGTASVPAGEALDLKTLDGYRVDTQAANQTLVWSMVLADANGQPITENGQECAVPETIAALDEGVLTTAEVQETGYILVRAASADGSDLTAQCFVTIEAVKPVTITVQPTDVTVAEGETAAVTVTAEGEGLTYEWYYKSATGSRFSKTTAFDGPTYAITMNESRNGRQVYCIVTDKYGNTAQSDTVTLNMTTSKVEIVTQPTDVTVASGEKAIVTFEAAGDELTYEWYYRNAGGSKFSRTSAFTSNTYSVTMSADRDRRQVYCVVTDKYGNTAQTDTVTLNMVSSLIITKQPVDVTAASGETATVTVEAEGEGLTYEWYFKNAGGSKFSKTSAFTSNTYSVTMSEARSGRQVYCVITDVDGSSVQSDTVTLTMAGTALEIVRQPESVTAASGETAAVTVEAAGDGLTYQWYFKNASGSKFSLTTAFDGPTYSVTMSASRSGRQVYCVITDAYGNSVQTDTVTLNMAVTGTLVITRQPEDVTVASGEAAAVTVEAEGEGLTYEWYFKNAGGSKFSKTSAFTSNTYSVTMSEARSGRQVYCVITDVDGNSVQTNTVTLTMASSGLQIVRQPESVTVAVGETAAVTVEAAGENLTYEWYFKNADGTKFSKTASFTGPTYSITMTESRSGRQVYCVITDADGSSVQTDTVTLSMVSTALAITKQPEDVTVASGEAAAVTVEAEGEGLTYEWYFMNAGGSKFSKTSAFTTNTYSVTMSAARSGRQVYCVITDVDGNTVQSDTVTLTMA